MYILEQTLPFQYHIGFTRHVSGVEGSFISLKLSDYFNVCPEGEMLTPNSPQV